MVNPIFIQAGAYGLLMIITILICAAVFRGFFFAYLRVRTSFGKYVMVKVRTNLRDYFKVGYVKEGFLIYKDGENTIRISISSDKKLFYRCLSVNWIDIDEDTGGVCLTDYSTVTGFDARKTDNLLVRALTRPVLSSGKEKVMLLLVCGAIIVALAAAYLAYQNYNLSSKIYTEFPSLIKSMAQQAVVTASTTG